MQRELKEDSKRKLLTIRNVVQEEDEEGKKNDD